MLNILFKNSRSESRRYKKWRKEDDIYLAENFDSKDIIDLCSYLGRTKQAVWNRLTMLRQKGIVTGRTFQGKKKFWSKTEESYIINNYKTISVDDIAVELGRSRSAVVNKMFMMRKTGSIMLCSDSEKQRF